METSPRDAALSRALGTLASSTRLAILRELRTPRTLTEIEIRVVPEDDPDGHPRPLARQTIRDHLDRLSEMGLVSAREAERSRGPTLEYSLNHFALFDLAEEMRDLARLRPEAEPRSATISHAPAPAQTDASGPSLVLVKGLDEGRTFALAAPPERSRTWTIGRSRGADIALDFDRFISSENCVISWEDGAFHLRDLPDSRNGTALNFRLLVKGERVALRTGDLIGAGRTLLLFRA